MNRNDLYRGFNDIDDDILERSEHAANRKPPWARWVTLAACLAVVLLAIILSAPLFQADVPEEPSTADTPVIIEPTASPSPPPEDTTPGMDINDTAIIWSENGMLDSVDTLGRLPTLPNQMAVTYTLKAALEEAEDDDLFAIVVTKYRTNRGEESDRYNEETYAALLDAREQANEALTASAQKVTAELMDTLGISSQEAGARKYSVPEFIEARNAAKAAKSAVSSYLLEWNFDSNRSALDQLVELGFTLVYDATDPAYQAYLSLIYPYTPLGVVIGTKEQIYALNPEELGYYYCFHMAAKNAADYEVTDNYSHSEVHLTGDNKLTDELIAAYGENGGAALPVSVKIAYWGKVYGWREVDSIVLNRLGFGNKTDLYVYGTEEDEEEFLREHRRIYHHLDYNYEVITRLLRDGELIQWDEFKNYYNCNFYAELTCERALELVQDRDIAYIELLDQTPPVQSTLDAVGNL